MRCSCVMTRSRDRPTVSHETILYVVIRDRNGRVAQKAVGSALVQADRDAGITTFALRKRIEPLTAFLVDSQGPSGHAKRSLPTTPRRLEPQSRSAWRDCHFVENSPMPSSRDKLSGEEMNDLVAYLVSLKGLRP